MIPQRTRRKRCGVIKCIKKKKKTLAAAFVFCRRVCKAKGLALLQLLPVPGDEMYVHRILDSSHSPSPPYLTEVFISIQP